MTSYCKISKALLDKSKNRINCRGVKLGFDNTHYRDGQQGQVAFYDDVNDTYVIDFEKGSSTEHKASSLKKSKLDVVTGAKYLTPPKKTQNLEEYLKAASISLNTSNILFRIRGWFMRMVSIKTLKNATSGRLRELLDISWMYRERDDCFDEYRSEQIAYCDLIYCPDG